MKKRTVLTAKKKVPKKKRIDAMRIICWVIVPLVMIGFITADALGINPITKKV